MASDDETKRGALASVLKSKGPVVSCVLLRHDTKSLKNDGESTTSCSDLDHLMEQVQVDTTPSQNGVRTMLGGPFTFVGQYPSEGVVVMARSDQVEEELDVDLLKRCSIAELRKLGMQMIPEFEKQTFVEKSDLVSAICSSQLPLNPHKLQPPLHRCTVRGNLLLMRVAGSDDDDEEEENEKDEFDADSAISKAMADMKQATAVSNDEFFLDYTKDEYLSFAARTDIVANDDSDEQSEGEGEEEEDEDDEEEGDDDDEGGDDEDEGSDEEFNPLEHGTKEEKSALLNIIMGEVLIEFRQLNERGPSSEELLDLRKQVAAKLSLELPEPPSPGPASSKRPAAVDTAGNTKRVKFDPDTTIDNETEDDDDDDNDGKPAAKQEEVAEATPAKDGKAEPAECS